MWLKKGYDYIVEENRFTDEDAVVKLGVGKNMVSSIKFWLKAFGMLDSENHLTNIAHYLFNSENGKDPYAEDNFTFWLLHYALLETGVASIYKLLFIELQREKREFDKEIALNFIRRLCNNPEQKSVFNENTVKKDVRVFFQNYLAPNNPKSNEEYASILISLGLIREQDGIYSFTEVTSEQVHPIVIYYALLSIAGEDKTISFDKLQELSLLFCMPMPVFLSVVRSLSERYPNELVYTDNSGIKNVQLLNKLSKEDVLNRYYMNDEI